MNSTAIPISPQTLAQKTAAEVRERMTEIDQTIESIDAEIGQINSVLMENWRHAAQSPAETERVSEDLEKAHRRRKLFQQFREKADADLQAALRQITLDRFAEKRGAFEAVMQARTKRARDVVATCEQLAALVEEIHTLGRDAIQLFTNDASDGGVSLTEALKTINRVHPQGHIDLLLSSRIDPGLWNASSDRRPNKHFRSEYADKIDAERTALLVELGSAARRVGSGGN